MPALPIIRSAFRRDNGDQVEGRLVNVFLEASPTDDDGVVMLSRAGLVSNSTPGTTGPVRGLFSKADLFGGDIFSVVGSNVYRGTALLGAIAGTGPVSFATDGLDEVLVTAGSTMRRYNGTTFVDVVFPDGAGVTAVGFINGLFVATRALSGRFYWSAINDGSSWNALDYATAESSSDNVLDMQVLGDTIWLFGKETVEPWAITGSTTLPFRRIEQRLYNRGIIATGAATEIGGRLYWVGDDARVYTDDLTPVSDEGIAERIRASTSWVMFSFTYEGHPFICVRLATATYAYSPLTQNWVQFTSYSRTNWRARTAMTKGTVIYLGDDQLNTIWTFGGDTESGSVIERIFSSYLPISGGTLTVHNIGVNANVGRTEALTGVGSEPMLEMRFSRDEGKNWSKWRATSLGVMGQYRRRPRFRRCGTFDAPGALFEFRNTDTGPFRISGLYMNETGGGRGR